jgi:hypothetical protein
MAIFAVTKSRAGRAGSLRAGRITAEPPVYRHLPSRDRALRGGHEKLEPTRKRPLTRHFAGAGDENRTRTISLGNGEIRAGCGPDLGGTVALSARV